MNKLLLIIIFSLLFLFNISTESIVLKKEIYTDKNTLTLQDITENKLDNVEYKNLEIKEIKNFPDKITSEEILEKLFDKNILGIAVIGKKCTIYSSMDTNNFYETTYHTDTTISPIEYLKEYLYSFINNENIDLEIHLIKTEPKIDIENIVANYDWLFSKTNYNIKEIQKLNKMPIIINNNKYNVLFDIKLMCNVWIAKQSFLKDDYFKKEAFFLKRLNLSNDNKINSVVFDISEAGDTKFTNNINIGDILRWDSLKKNPIVKKGEVVKIIFKKSYFELILPCTTTNDGYENERIKVKLVNGKELFGTLRKDGDGANYVEL